MGIRSRMVRLLDERKNAANAVDAVMKNKAMKHGSAGAELADTSKHSEEMDMRKVMAQLAMAMHALGMDPQDEDAQDKFVALLKKLGASPTTKNLLAKHAGKGASAKAMKAAKAAI